MQCESEHGCRHQSKGWLQAPNGRKIVHMCEHHAQACIAEYARVLKQAWTFATFGSEP